MFVICGPLSDSDFPVVEGLPRRRLSSPPLGFGRFQLSHLHFHGWEKILQVFDVREVELAADVRHQAPHRGWLPAVRSTQATPVSRKVTSALRVGWALPGLLRARAAVEFGREGCLGPAGGHAPARRGHHGGQVFVVMPGIRGVAVRAAAAGRWELALAVADEMTEHRDRDAGLGSVTAEVSSELQFSNSAERQLAEI